MKIIGFSNEYRFIEDLTEDIILDAILTEEDVSFLPQNKHILRCYFPTDHKYDVEYIDMFIVEPNGNYRRIVEEDLAGPIWNLAYEWCWLHRNLCIEKLDRPTLNHCP